LGKLEQTEQDAGESGRGGAVAAAGGRRGERAGEEDGRAGEQTGRLRGTDGEWFWGEDGMGGLLGW